MDLINVCFLYYILLLNSFLNNKNTTKNLIILLKNSKIHKVLNIKILGCNNLILLNKIKYVFF